MTDKDQFPSPDTWYGHFVSYGETDAMGVVYYGEYLHLFERARSQFIRERGMSYARVEEKGIFLPVREACCRFRAPLRYDQHIWVRCAISHWGRASMRFVYEVRDNDKKSVAATGETEHACVNPAGRPVRVPDWLKELFGK
ncbi:MAG: thioesterase family protein [Desulfovibrionaceae bacterium]|nr:thioesterase family protein [Desulfovibrionaceae bacterium]